MEGPKFWLAFSWDRTRDVSVHDPDGSECVLNFRRRRRSLAHLGIGIRAVNAELALAIRFPPQASSPMSA